MRMFSKKCIILIIIFILFAFVACGYLTVSARRAAFEADRTRYMSDILRITSEKSDTGLDFDGENKRNLQKGDFFQVSWDL